MKKGLFRTLSYVSMFTLGLYTSSQFIYNKPVETYRWVMTSISFLLWLALSNDKED